jgi:hypothetical protein
VRGSTLMSAVARTLRRGPEHLIRGSHAGDVLSQGQEEIYCANNILQYIVLLL